MDPMRPLGAKEILLGESTCFGDSRGPVFDQATGALLAVTSAGGNGYPVKPDDPPYLKCLDQPGYTTNIVFTRVDAFSDLIRENAALLGETLWEEGQPKPTTPPGFDPGSLGGLCGSSADSAPNLCAATGGRQV